METGGNSNRAMEEGWAYLGDWEGTGTWSLDWEADRKDAGKEIRGWFTEILNVQQED